MSDTSVKLLSHLDQPRDREADEAANKYPVCACNKTINSWIRIVQRELDPRDVRVQRLAICILERCSNVDSALPEGAETEREDLEVIAFRRKRTRRPRRDLRVSLCHFQ